MAVGSAGMRSVAVGSVGMESMAVGFGGMGSVGWHLQHSLLSHPMGPADFAFAHLESPDLPSPALQLNASSPPSPGPTSPPHPREATTAGTAPAWHKPGGPSSLCWETELEEPKKPPLNPLLPLLRAAAPPGNTLGNALGLFLSLLFRGDAGGGRFEPCGKSSKKSSKKPKEKPRLVLNGDGPATPGAPFVSPPLREGPARLQWPLSAVV